MRLRLIGDVVFTTPMIRALRRTFPAARLLYLVESSAAPIVANNPHLDRVITVPHTRGWTRISDDWRLSRDLRRERVDVAIDFHGGPRSALLTWATRAPVRVGYDVPGRQWMYTRTVHRPRELRPRHSVENQWDLLAAVDPGLSSPADPTADRVEMHVAPSVHAEVAVRLAKLGMPPDAQMIVLHVSAGNPFRRWPESAFAELASGLVATDHRRWVLVTSGPSDHGAAARVIRASQAMSGGAATRIVDVEGLTLSGLRALFDRVSLFVGGDSGPLHVAATSGVPVVGLYGPTLAERSAPWRPRDIPTASADAGPLPCRPCEQRACVPGDFRCLTRIGPETVLAAAERVLVERR